MHLPDSASLATPLHTSIPKHGGSQVTGWRGSAIAVLLSLLCSTGAFAASFTVNTTLDVNDGACSAAPGNCSLREAIIAANATPNVGGSNDAVIMVSGQTYTLTIAGANENAGATGDLDITEGLTLTTTGSTGVTIQGGATKGAGVDRVLHVNPNGNQTINLFFQRITIKNGTVSGNGGGMLWDGNSSVPSALISNITLHDSTFIDNIATGNGGGVWFDNVNVQQWTNPPNGITGNQAGGDGGAFWLNNSSVSVGQTTYQNNLAGNHGGVAYVTGNNATAKNVGFAGFFLGNKADAVIAAIPAISFAGTTSNNAGDGGAIYVGGSASPTDTRGNVFFFGTIGGGGANANTAFNGGCIYNSGVVSASVSSSTTTTFTGIASNNGGAIYNAGTLTLTATSTGTLSFQSSSAGGDGGAIYNAAGTTTISRDSLASGNPPVATTFSGNTATRGGAVAVAGGTATLRTLHASNNNARTNGGAFFVNAGTLDLCEVFMQYNNADSDGDSTGNGGGASVAAAGTLNISLSRFEFNSAPTATAVAQSGGTANAQHNWWGCDGFPGATGCQTVAGTVTSSPRIDLKAIASPSQILPNGTATVTADFTTSITSGNVTGTLPSGCSGGPSRPAPIVMVGTSSNAVQFMPVSPMIGTLSQTQAPMPASGQASTTFTSNGTVGTQQVDVSSAGGTASAFINVTNAATQTDLSVSQSVSSANPNVGDTIQITITVANVGPHAAQNVSVRDLLPSNLTFDSIAFVTEGSYNVATGVWSGVNVPAAGSDMLQINAIVANTSTQNNVVEVIAADGDDADSTPNNGVTTEDDYSTFEIAPAKADLSVTVTATPNSIGENNLSTLTVTVTNANSPDSSVSATVTVGVTLDSDLIYVSDNSGGSYDSTTGVWTVGTVGVGSSASLEIVVRGIDAPPDGPLLKQVLAQVTASDVGDPDSVPNDGLGDDRGTTTVRVDEQNAPLGLTKTVNRPSPEKDDQVTFTISLSNTTPHGHHATNVVVNDVLPSGLTYNSSNPSMGSYDPGTGNWTIASLPPGSPAATLQITATVNTNAARTNTATITSWDGSASDGNTSNNSATATVTPLKADLSVTTSVSPTIAQSGDSVTFHIEVTSADGAFGDAKNVVVSAILGAGLAFDLATPSQGTYNPVTGDWDLGVLSPGDTATLDIAAIMGSGSKMLRAQVKSVEQLDPDSTPNNNNAFEDDDARVTVTENKGSGMFCAESIIELNSSQNLPGVDPCDGVSTSLNSGFDSVTAGAPSAGGIGTNAVVSEVPSRATPFPSTIRVAGMTPNLITSVKVHIKGLKSPRPADLDFMLVAPDGTAAVIWSEAGGRVATANFGTTGINVTLDDAAATPLPHNPATPLASGTYQPADYENSVSCDAGDSFPAPAPAAPNVSALSTFAGKPANGVWRLFIVDDEGNGVTPVDGSIANGWCLEVLTNSPPDAVNDTATVVEDSGANTIDVLANDTDPESDARTITSANPTASRGNVTCTATQCTYTPNANEFGSDSFTYTIQDTFGNTDTATVSVTITEVNDTPAATNDSVTAAEDTPLTFAASSLTANDSKGAANESAQTLTVTAVGSATNGTVSLDGSGNITFTPNANFSGSGSFQYTVTDNGTTNGSSDPKSATGTVNVSITEVNDAPTAADDSKSATEDTPLVFAASELVGNDSTGPANESAQTLTVTAVSNPVNGTVSLSGGTITFTPAADFNGTASFDYTVTDNGTTNGASDPKSDIGTVSVTVSEVNDAPVPAADSKSTAEDTQLVFAASDLVANDSRGAANESAQTLTVTAVSNPTNGTVLLDGSGNITFTPDANFNGNATFDYSVTDNGTTNGSADPKAGSGTVSVTVTAVNDAPTASADSKSTAEDVQLVFAASDLVVNDSKGPANESSQTLTVTAVSNPVNGTVSLSSGTITFTPAANFNGTASFDYTVTDDGTTNGSADPKSSTATVTVTVTDANDAPVANADAKSATEDQNLVFTASDLVANDTAGASDESAQTLTVTAVSNPVNGTVSLSAGTITFTPDADFNGAASFQYTVTDNGTTNGSSDPKSSVGTVNVTVAEVNDAPTAVDDSGSTAEDTPVVFSTATLTSNDSKGPANESAQTLTIASVGNAVNGTVSVSAGNVTFTPAANFSGTASFDYTITDNGTTNGAADPLTDTATVTITVTDVNDAPVANTDAKGATEDQNLVFTASDLVANDTAGAPDESSQTLTVTAVSNPVNGTVSLVAGTITFTPDADFSGAASFQYTVTDNGTTNGSSDPKSSVGTVNVTVAEVNDAPTAVDDSGSTAEDTPAVFTTATLTSNDSKGPANESSQTLTIASVTNAVNGTVSLNGGNVTFTPAANFSGTASFDYTLTDNGTTNGAADPLTDTATVTITVTEVNDAPTAATNTVTTAEDTALTFAAATLTANDSAGPSDESGQTLTVTSVGNAVNGTVSLDGSGNITFTPNANFNGTASFDYTVTDNGTTNGAADPKSATATVTVTVTEVNDAPTATADSKSTAEDAPLTFPASDLTANDSANDAGQTVTVTAVSNPTNGTVSLTAGNITFTPNADFQGTATFDYTITDDGTTNGNPDPKTATAVVTVTVTEVNDAPVAANDAASTAEDTPVAITASTLTANDSKGPSNESAQTLTVTSVSNAVNGTVVLNSGTITFTPNANFNGSASFQYTVTDDGTTNGTADPKTSTGTVTVTVTEVNDAPVAVNDAKSAVEDTPLAFAASDLTANDSTGAANEAQTLTVTSVGSAVNGTVALVAGTITFTPDANFNGAASFQYTVTDDGTTNGAADPKSITATVTVTVSEANDPPTANADSSTTAEDTPLVLAPATLLANDSRGPANESSQTLTITSVGNATNGTVAIVNGNVVFTPAANYHGPATFDYTITDDGTTSGAAAPATSTATVTVTVTEVNDAPVTVPDVRSTQEDTPLTFAASTLVANDNAGAADESSQTLTVIGVGNATNGVVSLDSGTITFTPNPDFNGNATFSYTVQDNGTTNGASDPKTRVGQVTVTVDPVNDAPIAFNDTYQATEDTPLTVSVGSGVLANDTDIDGDVLRAIIVTQPAHGTVTLNSNGSFVYTPAPDFNGTDSFTYSANDDVEPSNPAVVTITVAPVADAATATVSGDATVCSGSSATINVTLTGTAPWTIRWSDGLEQTVNSSPATRTVTPFATTTYTITSVTDASSLTGSGSGSATITVVPTPQPAISGPSSAVLGTSVTLTATPGFDSYQWLHDDEVIAGATASTYTIASLGSEDLGRYTVRVTSGNCSGDSLPFELTLNNEAILPIVGQTAGANGSNFLSALVLSNPSDLALAATEMTGELRFFRDGALIGKYPYSLAPGATRYVTDFLPAGFTGLATVSAVPSKGALPLMIAHVFDDQGVNGTSGLIERAIRTGDAATAGDRVVLIAPADPQLTRFNVGVRALGDGLSFRLTQRDANGAVVTTLERSLGAHALLHTSAEQLIGRVPGASDALTFEILSGAGVIYGASTDNRTNDPNMQIAAPVEESRAAVSQYVIVVAGSTRGAFNSNFKTGVQLHNPSSAAMTAAFVYHRSGVSGSASDPSMNVTVAPHSTLNIDDLLPRLGESGLGTIDLFVTSAVRPIAVVRVFNDSASGQTSMTEELLQPGDAVVAGQRASVIASHIPARARFNIGIRTLANGARIRATVQDRDGAVLRTTDLQYGPLFFTHAGANDLLGLTFVGDERVTFEVLEGAAFFYGVWTDNVTQDPSFTFAIKP